MRTNKNTSKIILATIVAILATAISYTGFKNMSNQLSEQQKLIEVMQKTKTADPNYKENYAYAVATADLKAGEIVADQDVDFKQFDAANTNAFDNRSDVVNKVLLKDITSGEAFTTAHIAKISSDDLTLKDGYRALTLPADSFQGRSDKMTPGSFVDIYSASSDNNWVLEDVKILSAEGASPADAGKTPSLSSATAITFEVAADNISDFISNISKSKLVLVARGANDKKVVHKKSKFPSGNYNAGSMSPLPKLPASVPISNFSAASGMSGLPQPIQPVIQTSSVEVIEANVKSKVTFD